MAQASDFIADVLEDSEFLLNRNPQNFTNAITACEVEGATLARIGSQTENNFVRGLLLDNNIAVAWIGIAQSLISFA